MKTVESTSKSILSQRIRRSYYKLNDPERLEMEREGLLKFIDDDTVSVDSNSNLNLSMKFRSAKGVIALFYF